MKLTTKADVHGFRKSPKKSSHTPTPWVAHKQHSTWYIESSIRAYTWQEVAACGPTEEPAQQEANAAYIVKCVNSHEDLVEALRCLTLACDWMATDANDGSCNRHLERAYSVLASLA